MRKQHEHYSVNKQTNMSERSHKDLRTVNGDHMHAYYHAAHSQTDTAQPVATTDMDTTSMYANTQSGMAQPISI